MNKAIIVDIDGTIADAKHRLHFIRDKKKKDYDKFFDAMGEDPPMMSVIEMIVVLSEHYEIIFVTGRPESHRQMTLDWMERHAPVLWLKAQLNLHMRPTGNYKPDTQIKRSAYHYYIKPNYHIVGVFEDRKSVVDMWRKLGLTVYQVDDWEESK